MAVKLSKINLIRGELGQPIHLIGEKEKLLRPSGMFIASNVNNKKREDEVKHFLFLFNDNCNFWALWAECFFSRY